MNTERTNINVRRNEPAPDAKIGLHLQGGNVSELRTQARKYIEGRLHRNEITADSARMPWLALRELSDSFGNRPLDQLGEPAIHRWLETNTRKSPGTRRNELGAVRAFCRWLVREGKLRRDPTVAVSKIKQPRKAVHTVTRPEVSALWGACQTPRDRALVGLMFTLGLRAVDAARLNVDDWDRTGGLLMVTGKGMHERVLPVTERLAGHLAAHIACHPRTTGAMFPSAAGRLKPATISGRISGLMYDAGVKTGPYDGKTGHALRRTCATETLESSRDLRAVQDLLGHADLSSLKHYIKRSEVAKIRDAINTRFDDVA